MTKKPPCFKRIGLAGDASCEHLAEVGLCTNCPRFAALGRALFDREAPAEQIEEWTRLLAEAKTAEPAGTRAALVFRLGGERYALASRFFLEITEPLPVRTLPRRSGRVLRGLVNVGGELVPCLSLAAVLGVGGQTGAAAPAGSECMAVVGTREAPFVVRMDAVLAAHRYAPDEISPPPATLEKAAAHYTTGLIVWQGRRVGLLDEQALAEAFARSLTP